MTTLTDDELAAMTVLDSDTDSQLFSSEGDTQGRLKTYDKPDMTTEEKEQWKLVTNSRDEKRRRRREAKKKEGETTRKETKMTKANDESPTKKKVTFVTNQDKKDNQINQPIKQITTPPRTNQTNGLSHLFMTPTEEAKLIGKGKNDDNTTKNETELSRAAYAEFYHAPPPESNRNPTKIDYEDNAVKEAKFYLRVYPHDRSRFDPHIAFAEFYHVVHEVDNEALICPFDKHSTKPVLMDAHDLPNTKERLHYLYNLKERNGAWSCVVRIQTEIDDWKLLATSQMRTFLNQTGMKATKQELDSPNLAQAGWFVGLHPRLTNRKSLQHRIEKHYPEGTNIPIEIRGGEVYLPRGVG